MEEIEDSPVEKKKILERNDLKYALSTMSKLVENYNYDLIKWSSGLMVWKMILMHLFLFNTVLIKFIRLTL